VVHLKEQIAKVTRQRQSLEAIGGRMKATEDRPIRLTGPDARSMATSGRGIGIRGCNAQTAAHARHPRVAAHDLTHAGHDRDQRAGMARLAEATTGEEELVAPADRGGDDEGYEIVDCEGAGVADHRTPVCNAEGLERTSGATR